MTDPTPDPTPAITMPGADTAEAFGGTLDQATAMAERLAQLVAERAAARSAATAAGPAEPPVGFLVIDEAHEIIAGRFGRGKSNPADQLVAEMMLSGRAPMVLDVKASDHSAWLQPWPAQKADPAAVAAAMAGYRTSELTIGETEALKRGIDPSTYRRLYPAVTGELADHLAGRIIYLASFLTARTANDDVYTRLLPDPRTPGWRLALHEARIAAPSEPLRRLGALIEWAMNAIVLGREQTARAKLDQADAIVA